MKKYFRISPLLYWSWGMTLGATLFAEVVATPIIFTSMSFNSQLFPPSGVFYGGRNFITFLKVYLHQYLMGYRALFPF